MAINSGDLAKLFKRAGLPTDLSKVVNCKVCFAMKQDKRVPDAREYLVTTITSVHFITGYAGDYEDFVVTVAGSQRFNGAPVERVEFCPVSRPAPAYVAGEGDYDWVWRVSVGACKECEPTTFEAELTVL